MVHLWLWHWRDGPGWVRSASDELRQLRADGAGVIRIQLQDDGEVPLWLVDLYKYFGYKVWGAIRPSGDPLGGSLWSPWAAAGFGDSERRRLGLNGIDWNFEREVRLADAESGGAWSRQFKPAFRARQPRVACALDTVFGDFAGGIENVYTPGFRMNVQTYWGGEGIYDDPVPKIVEWCAGAQPKISKAVVKPVFRVTRNNNGELLDRSLAISDSKKAGTIGNVLYYIDGAEFDYLRAFVRESIAEGVALR